MLASYVYENSLKKYRNERIIMQNNKFVLHSEYKPTGDQPEAIKYLTDRTKRW